MKLLVFSVHLQETEICVGGSLLRYLDHGWDVQMIHMERPAACIQAASQASSYRCEFLDFEAIEARQAKNADRNLGIQFDPEHLAVVDAKLRLYRPDLVWTHWPVDTDPDHLAAGGLVMRACDQIRLEETEVWCPELWFFSAVCRDLTVHFHPDHYEDISHYVSQKKEAVSRYGIENIQKSYALEETVMKHSGYASGYAYAEAFMKCHFRVGQARYEVIGDNMSDS